MDLQDTRTIPMWLAHPVLPVAVGVCLFVALAVVSTLERRGPVAGPPAVTGPTQDIGPDRSAGTPRIPEGAVRAQGAAAAGRELTGRSRRGDFVGALKVLHSYPPAAWARARLFADEAAYDAQEDMLILRASELLMLRAKNMEPGKAIAALEALLATDGVVGHPAEAKLRKTLEGLR